MKSGEFIGNSPILQYTIAAMSEFYRTRYPRYFVLPAEFADNVPLINGHLNGNPVRFLFDSGAQDTLLNARYVSEPPTAEGAGIRGVSGEAPSFYTQMGELVFGPWEIEMPEVMAIDCAHLEEELSLRVDGIIGFRAMIQFDWMVDYDAKEIHFWDRVDRSTLAIAAKVKCSYRSHLPLFEATIAGNTYKLLLDTGASTLVFDASKRDLILAEVTDLVNEEMASSSPIKMPVETGVLSSFEVGGLRCDACKINFADLSSLQQRFGDFDGIVGYPLMCRYRTIVSWNARGLILLAPKP
jgi:hypothetical protein